MKIPKLKSQPEKRLKGASGWGWFMLLAIFILELYVIAEIYSKYLFAELSAALFISLTIFNVIILFSLYSQKESAFLGIYRLILYPFVNLFLMSVLFLQVESSSHIGFLIGFWVIYSGSFALSSAFIWLTYFNKKTSQTVWTEWLSNKLLKLYIFTFLSLALGLFVTIFLGLRILNIEVVTDRAATIWNYLSLISSHFLILTMPIFSLGFFVNLIPLRKIYCKMCIEVVRNRFVKKQRANKFTPTGEYVNIFQSVINRANSCLEWYHKEMHPVWSFNPSQPPRILNKNLYYKKLLMADFIQNKQRLNELDKARLRKVKDGLEKMSKSMDNKGDKFFYSFVEGLTHVANSGETKPKFNIEDGFELKSPSVIEWIKNHHVIVGFIVSIIVAILSLMGFLI